MLEFSFTNDSTKDSSGDKESSKNNEINIQPIDDPFARYKMPAISSRIKAKGQYSETYINNLLEISKRLKTPVEAISKFISFDLNTPIKVTDDYYILKGSFTDVVLLISLRKYIDKCVLCSKCRLPEISYIKEKKSLKYECASCGLQNNCDITDKIFKQIFNSI